MMGLNPCNKPRCSWCRYIDAGKTFKSTATSRTFKILHKLDCKSSFVIYAIECTKCKKQYVGKSETDLNIRLNNHRSHIKNKIKSCEIAEHFIDNLDHNFEDDIKVTAIEKLKNEELDDDRKKHILKNRETFWIRTLNTFQPLGLNKRMG